MAVRSSHLALRFYKSDGWTREILECYLIRGRVLDVWADQPMRDYWFLDHELRSELDMQRLMDERVSAVYRWYAGEPKESDMEYLQMMNR